MALICIRRCFVVSALVCFLIMGIQGKILQDLRRFHVIAKAGLFSVPRSSLEVELSNIKAQDAICGNDVNINIAPSTEDQNFAKLGIGIFTIEDHTLEEELSSDTKSEVDVRFRHVVVSMPFASGERRGVIFLAHFTDSKKRTFFPYSTNYGRVDKIDSIEETEDGTITLTKGDDVMIMKFRRNDTCRPYQSAGTRKDFDRVTGKLITGSDYPFSFDWGCDTLGDDVSFCSALKENACELSRAGSDVCVELTANNSKRCSANMQILSMTGLFDDAVPYLSAPVSSIDGMWVDREHGSHIVYPCFTT